MKISIVIPKRTDNLAYALEKYATCKLENHKREIVIVDDNPESDAIAHAFMKNLKVKRRSDQIFKTWFEANFLNHSISKTLEGIEPEVTFVRSTSRISHAGSVCEAVSRCTGDVIVLHGCSHPGDLPLVLEPVLQGKADVCYGWNGSLDFNAKLCGRLFGRRLKLNAVRAFTTKALKSLPLGRYNIEGEIAARILLSGEHRIQEVKTINFKQGYNKLSAAATLILFWLRRDLRRKISLDELYDMASKEKNGDVVLGYMRNVSVEGVDNAY